MAGGAGLYIVDGGASFYTTIADAITQLVADEDGGLCTASQEIRITTDLAENAITPNHTAVKTTSKYRIRVTGSGTPKPVLTGYVKCGYGNVIDIYNLTMTSTDLVAEDNQSNIGSVYVLDVDYTAIGVAYHINGFDNIVFENCTLDFGAGWGVHACVSHYYKNCKIRGANTIFHECYRMQLENCRIHSDSANTDLSSCFSGLTLMHCTISNMLCVQNSKPGVRSFFYNNIFNVAYFRYALHVEWGYENQNFGKHQYNIYDFIGSNNFITYTAGTRGYGTYATLADFQAEGWDLGSTAQAVVFASTDITNANFLKLTESLKTAKNCGIYEDFEGTVREKYSDIDPGAHQYAAATEDAGGGIQLGPFESGVWR